MRSGQLTWRQRGWLWARLGIRLVLVVMTAFLLTRFGRPLLSLLAPFAAALVAAAILNPLVRWVQKRIGWSRQTVTLVLLLLLLVLLGVGVGFLGYAAGQELLALVRDWNGLVDKLRHTMEQMEVLFARLWALVPVQFYDAVQNVSEGLMDWLNNTTPTLLNGVLDYTTNKAMGVPSFVVALVMFVMGTYFLTADYPYMRTRAIQSMDEDLLRFLGQLKTTALGAFGGYLKAQLLLSGGVFFLLLAGFLVTRQPYGLLLALGLAVLDFIPLLGAGTVMVPWAALAFIIRDYPTAIRVIAIWSVIALFRRVMEPKFVGDQTGLSPILSLVSIYVGMKLAGVAGMILGPILTLVFLNLSGMGMFRNVRADLSAAAGDVAAILSDSVENL